MKTEIIEQRGLSFGQALTALEGGKRIARDGWNGKGMFLFLLPADTVPKKVIHDPALRGVVDHCCEGETFDAVASIRMKTADDKILTGWLASQSDMMAKDWTVMPALAPAQPPAAPGPKPNPSDWKTIVADAEARHKKGGTPGSWQDVADFIRAQYGDGSPVEPKTAPEPAKAEAPKTPKKGKATEPAPAEAPAAPEPAPAPLLLTSDTHPQS